MALRFSGRSKRSSHTPPALDLRISSLMRGRLGAEIDLAVGREPYERRPGGDVLIELLAVDLVEGVVGAVVDVEIVRAILQQREPGYAGLDRRADVGAGIARGRARRQHADRLEHAQHAGRELAPGDGRWQRQ